MIKITTAQPDPGGTSHALNILTYSTEAYIGPAASLCMHMTHANANLPYLQSLILIYVTCLYKKYNMKDAG